MYVKLPLSPRNVDGLLAGRAIDICHETVRLRWNRFGQMYIAEIRRKRVQWVRAFTHWHRENAGTGAPLPAVRLSELITPTGWCPSPWCSCVGVITAIFG